MEDAKEPEESKMADLKKPKPKKKSKWKKKDKKLLKAVPYCAQVDDDHILDAKWFDLSKLEVDPIPNLLAASKATKKGTIIGCTGCFKGFADKAELIQHILEKHNSPKLFCDLDPEQQERAIRANEIYLNIDLTHTSFNENNECIYSELSSPNDCGCTIDGFKNWSVDEKYKIHISHFLVGDHRDLDSCKKCGLYIEDGHDGYRMIVHEYFDCDDQLALKVFK